MFSISFRSNISTLLFLYKLSTITFSMFLLVLKRVFSNFFELIICLKFTLKTFLNRLDQHSDIVVFFFLVFGYVLYILHGIQLYLWWYFLMYCMNKIRTRDNNKWYDLLINSFLTTYNDRTRFVWLSFNGTTTHKFNVSVFAPFCKPYGTFVFVYTSRR